MSVINTNYLALVSQNNLQKSQSALGSAIERLSSGMRINSAKDDAAGQAIANRFTANIKGLTQATRNANDGISIAQTTEGSLNEINNNLQRIRELSVQAANNSNSGTDLKSIQDEINQRLDEIDRVAKQTNFNGTDVLNETRKLTVQVGSKDSETIEISLSQINRETLGLTKLDMQNQMVSKDAAGNNTFTAANTTVTNMSGATAVPTILASAAPATWDQFEGVLGGGGSYTFGVRTSASNELVAIKDGTAYSAAYNASTGKITVGAALGSAASITTTSVGYFNATDTSGGLVNVSTMSTGMVDRPEQTISTVLMRTSAGGTQEFFVDVSGAMYAASVDWANHKINVNMGASLSASAYSGATSVTANAYLTAAGTASVTLNWSAVTVGTTSTNALKQLGSAYYVMTSAGEYYKASLNTGNGNITVTSSVAINENYNLAAISAALGGSNTVMNYKGGSALFVQNTNSAGDVTYYRVKDSGAGNITFTGSTAQASQAVVDPLDTLDKALQKVDGMRSELGAVQNRFQSTIANLNNTINNLSAARSRIEDADYAVEVSNMTRAQILQQAGTSVLAQANQVPQTVLSLLR